ncbi:unnamed protein product [Closterium sp. NIES-65]|nr:unnamed protein product [Closterium sp. NIES-65]
MASKDNQENRQLAAFENSGAIVTSFDAGWRVVFALPPPLPVPSPPFLPAFSPHPHSVCEDACLRTAWYKPVLKRLKTSPPFPSMTPSAWCAAGVCTNCLPAGRLVQLFETSRSIPLCPSPLSLAHLSSARQVCEDCMRSTMRPHASLCRPHGAAQAGASGRGYGPEEAVESNGQRTPSLSDVPPLKPLSDPSLLPTHLGLPPFLSSVGRPMPGVARP